MRISDCSSDVCSSDLNWVQAMGDVAEDAELSNFYEMTSLVQESEFMQRAGSARNRSRPAGRSVRRQCRPFRRPMTTSFGRRHMPRSLDIIDADGHITARSEEHTSELQSPMRISYAVF